MSRRIVIAALVVVPLSLLAVAGWRYYDTGAKPDPALAPPRAPLLPDLVMPPLADVAATFAADGTRKIQFSASIANLGDGPFIVHGVRPSSRSDQWLVTQRFRETDGSTSERETPGTMTWGGHGHNHWHVKLGATYRLEPLGSQGETLRKLVKAGYCFFDNEPFGLDLEGAPHDGVYPKGTCSTLDDEEFEMGLSVGWEDPYYWILPDQSIDITGLPSGDYRLVAKADPDDWFDEVNETNNEVWATLRLTERDDGAPLVDVLRYGPGAEPSVAG